MPNIIKNENDLENNEVVVTFESVSTQEDAEEMRKLSMMKQKKRKLEMEEEQLQEKKQALEAEIEEQKARVLVRFRISDHFLSILLMSCVTHIFNI